MFIGVQVRDVNKYNIQIVHVTSHNHSLSFLLFGTIKLYNDCLTQ